MLAEGSRCHPETGGRDDRASGRQIVLAMITDADGRLAFANGELLTLGGWRWSDLSGCLWHEVLIAPEHRRRVVRAFDRAVAGKDETACVEAPLRTSDGRVLPPGRLSCSRRRGAWPAPASCRRGPFSVLVRLLRGHRPSHREAGVV